MGATELDYGETADPSAVPRPVYSTLRRVTRACYQRVGHGYRRRDFPSMEFGYVEPTVAAEVVLVPREDASGLPLGAGTTEYRWADLRGDGTTGILTETHGGAWLYAPNVSAGSDRVRFGPLETVPERPNLDLADGAQLFDLTGDGGWTWCSLTVGCPGCPSRWTTLAGRRSALSSTICMSRGTTRTCGWST